MEITWKEKKGSHVIRLNGRLDIIEADNFEKSVIQRLSPDNCTIVVNLSGISYMSSSGIRALLSIYRHCKTHYGKMALCDVSPVVQKVLDVVDLGQVFKVFPNEDQALQFILET